jgi:hypothetical protein
MKVYGFYHILGNRRGREIVPLQMNRLHDSGLLDQTETFFVGSVGEPVDVYCPAAVRFHSNETGRYEMWTLQRLWEESQAGDFLAYYFHTKGASWQSRDERWRLHMEETVIDQHEQPRAVLRRQLLVGQVRLHPSSGVAPGMGAAKCREGRLRAALSGDLDHPGQLSLAPVFDAMAAAERDHGTPRLRHTDADRFRPKRWPAGC